MKLLLDQNLSQRLLPSLEPAFPGSRQVRSLDLEAAADFEIWSFAQAQDFAIVTKDSDFVELSALYGPPPKIVWLNLGNVSNNVVMAKLVDHVDTILAFLANPVDGVLEIE